MANFGVFSQPQQIYNTPNYIQTNSQGQSYVNYGGQSYPQSTSSNTTNTSSNTGGSTSGSSSSGSSSSQSKTSGWTSPEGQTFGSEGEFNSIIDNAFNEQMGYLNKAESALQSDYSGVQKDIEGQYTTNQALLEGQKKTGEETLASQQTSGTQRKEDAMAAARRLYSELMRGNAQRFGGASSAGQAATELQNVEAQRNLGETQRQYNDFLTQIETQKNQLQRNYDAAVLDLKTKKDAALNQATRDFQAKLLTIQQSRAEASDVKAQRRLQALYDYRNKVFAINQQNTQFEQQLTAMKEQAALNLQNYQTQTAANLQSGQTGLTNLQSNTTINPTTGYGVGGTNQSTTSTPVGATTSTSKNWWDTLLGS